MIDIRLIDGRGNSNVAKVNGEGELSVVVHPHPPRDEERSALPVRERFADSGGLTAMAVDGSSTPVDYTVNAEVERDIYIKMLSVEISDGGSPALNKFGALAALTNGVEWCWASQSQGDIILHDGIKTNLEFMRLGGHSSLGFGDGTNALLADVSGGGTASSYLPMIDLGELFGTPFGIRLRRGTKDKLVFKVQDDLSTLTSFDIIAYGLKI